FHAWGDELLALLKRPAHVPGPGELRRDRELFLLGETPEDQLRAGSGGETVHLEVFRRKPRALVAIENLGDPGWVARERGQPQHEQDLTSAVLAHVVHEPVGIAFEAAGRSSVVRLGLATARRAGDRLDQRPFLEDAERGVDV